jgi:hypothetical protein
LECMNVVKPRNLGLRGRKLENWSTYLNSTPCRVEDLRGFKGLKENLKRGHRSASESSLLHSTGGRTPLYNRFQKTTNNPIARVLLRRQDPTTEREINLQEKADRSRTKKEDIRFPTWSVVFEWRRLVLV